MVTIKLVYFTPISDFTGKKDEEMTFDNAVTLGDLIRTVILRSKNELTRYFYDKNGQYKLQCLVLHNGTYCPDISRKINDGDEVSFIPPIAGG